MLSQILQVECGLYFSLALTSEGDVLTCGEGKLGINGDGADDRITFLSTGSQSNPIFKNKSKFRFVSL